MALKDKLVTLEDLKAVHDVDADEISSIKADLLHISSQPVLEWTLGKIISSSGSEGSSATGAMSGYIAVNGGDIISRPYPVKDNNGIAIIIHVCQYRNGVFHSRTSLTAIYHLYLDAETDSIRFNCSRASSTGIPMTQADLDSYFTAKVYRKCALSVDSAKNLKSVTITSTIARDNYNNLLTNLEPNSYAWVDSSLFEDSPFTGLFYIFNLKSFSDNTTLPFDGHGSQIAINTENGNIYTRRIKSGTWTSWSDNTTDTVYYAFGDSLTWGAVWDSDQSTSYYQADTPQQIPTRIANAIRSRTFYNLGASGARYVRQSGDSASTKTIVDLVKETDLSQADIVTIGGGRNDSATALGDGDTATAGDGTICGAIVDMLSYLTTSYPSLQIVLYGVTPQPTNTSHAPSDIYTRVFSGGWSLTTFYEEVAKACKRYGVPFVDWYDCPLIMRWGVLSGGYSSGTQNWSHPLSGDTYKQMGNYLAGRVSSYYAT